MIKKQKIDYSIMVRRLSPLLNWPLAGALLLSGGCATHEWQTPVAEERSQELTSLVDTLYQRDRQCAPTLTADLQLSYQTPLSSQKISGYFSFSQPSFYKVVTSNPFGQPIFLLAGDQQYYQAINTLQRRYWAGSLRTFARRNEVPKELVSGQWGSWITGRISQPTDQIEQIWEDRDGRGIWVSYANMEEETHDGVAEMKLPSEDETEKTQRGHSYLLLNPQQQTIQRRIEEDAMGNIIAEIDYDQPQAFSYEGVNCYQPQSIHIHGLQYGTEIELELSSIALEKEPQHYRLPVPSGYLLQMRP